ncbi:MAG TPA: tetratricopeptide repeat protein, partial [Candidatus Ozemobacteraceae bacterium]|nr:tetratricopeptide repeat protein [Candidatus Ozemobacteraceae bacterium]
MSKIVCPFLGFATDADRGEKPCLLEKCTFYNTSEACCTFHEIGKASREYLTSLKQLAEQNELILLRDRCAAFTPDEKTERMQLYMSQGSLSMAKGDHERATLDFKKALILDPLNPKAHQGLGDIYSLQGIFDEAISSYKSVLRADPESGETWIKLILQYRAMFSHLPHRETLYAEVTEKLRDELRALESQSMANCIMGFIMLILHSADSDMFKTQRDEARALMERALELNQSNMWAYLGMKDILFYEHAYDAATEQLTQAIQVIPENPRLYFELGECHLLSQAERPMILQTALQSAY